MKAIFFDLDGTLYDTEQYYGGALLEIAEYIAPKYRVAPQKIYKALMEKWKEKTSQYAFLFNDVVKNLEIPSNEINCMTLIFNNYRGKLSPYEDARKTIGKLKKGGYILGIVTDGNSDRQKRKIQMLGMEKNFDIIIYAQNIASKPSEKPFAKAAESVGIDPEDALYVGDNPCLDFLGPKKIGMKTIRILRGEFKQASKNKNIDLEIRKFDELFAILTGKSKIPWS